MYCCNQGYSAHNRTKSLCKLHQILFDHLKLQQQLPWERITAVYIYMRNLRFVVQCFPLYLCTYKTSNLKIFHSLDLPPNFEFYIEKTRISSSFWNVFLIAYQISDLCQDLYTMINYCLVEKITERRHNIKPLILWGIITAIALLNTFNSFFTWCRYLFVLGSSAFVFFILFLQNSWDHKQLLREANKTCFAAAALTSKTAEYGDFRLLFNVSTK